MTLTLLYSTIFAHHIDVWGYSKFEHPEHYGLARECLPVLARDFSEANSPRSGKDR
jgi:hypothetical protein